MVIVLAFAMGDAPILAAVKPGGRVKDFLEKHCSDCHDADTQKGKFRVDNLRLELATADAAKDWGRVLNRLDAGEMPPPKRDRPPQADLAAVLAWTKTALAAEAKVRRGEGRTRIRRMNRLEYENTLHDLLGIEIPLQDLLPDDDIADGFDTASAALSISPVHIQRYMDAAEMALKAAVIREPRPDVVRKRFSFADEKEHTTNNIGHGNNKPMIQIRDGNLVFFAEPHIEVPIHSAQFTEVTKAQPGRYRVRVSAFAHDAQGRSLGFALKTTRSKKLLGYFDAPAEKPAVAEAVHWFAPNDTVIIAPYLLNRARRERKLSQYPAKDGTPPAGLGLGIEWIEIEGPLNDVWPPIGQQRLFDGLPLKSFKELPKDMVLPGPLQQLRYSAKLTPVSENPEADAKRLLTGFLGRAFRRPVSAEDVAPYLGIVTQHLGQKECFESAMVEACQTALCSPDFLFLVEEPGPLSNHALASRLSYFLTRSAPDDQLRAAADRGELRKPEALRRETERLVTSPRSQAFVADFLDHWLHLRDLDATMPDKELFPEFYEILSSSKVDGLLRESFAAETRLFFTDLLKTDGSLLKMIDSDFTYLNSRLAEFYGLPAVEGVAMRRVALPADCARGGVLTQASVLKVTANGSRTSPVLRGAWVLDNIIGRPPLPPPPNTGSIEPDTRGATTIREQLAKHQNSETCASCHRQIDPPGFALEAFDPVGQSRAAYRTTETGREVKSVDAEGGRVKYRIGADVDASGNLPDGSAFAGPKEFKKLMLRQSDAVARCLAAKLISYSTGRRSEPGDILALDAIVAASKKRNFGLRTLLHAVVQSELFVNK